MTTETVTIQCPLCRAKLKLRRSTAAVRTVRCTQCQRAFRYRTGQRHSSQADEDQLSNTLASFQDEFEADGVEDDAADSRSSRKPKASKKRKKSSKSRASRRKVRPELEKGEWPIKWIVVAVMFLVALFGWGQAAACYARNEEGWNSLGESPDEIPRGTFGRRGARAATTQMAAESMANFVANAFQQIPNAPRIFVYTLKNALWHPILFGCLEAGILLIGLKLRSLQIKMAHERREVPP